HTHADGVIHIHPYSQLGVGANSTLGRYIDDARESGGFDIDLSDTKLTYEGETYEEGETTGEGVDDPQLRVAYWSDVQYSDDPPEIRTGDFKSLRLTEDGAGITVFFGDANADIPKPPKAGQLAELGALDGGQVPNEDGVTTTTEATDSASDDDATTTTAADDAEATEDTTSTTAAG